MFLRIYILLAMVALLAGCTIHPVETDLYFGRSMSDNREVSDSAWDAFVRVDVAAAFSDGFTVVQTEGGWRDGGITTIEKGEMVIVVHAPGGLWTNV